MLAVTAGFLARETKGLLIGEPADPAIVMSLLRIAREMEGMGHANGILTVHLAPQQIVVALSLEFADELKTPAIEIKVTSWSNAFGLCIRVIAVFTKPQTAIGYAETVERRRGKTRQIVFHAPPQSWADAEGFEAES